MSLDNSKYWWSSTRGDALTEGACERSMPVSIVTAHCVTAWLILYAVCSISIPVHVGIIHLSRSCCVACERRLEYPCTCHVHVHTRTLKTKGTRHGGIGTVHLHMYTTTMTMFTISKYECQNSSNEQHLTAVNTRLPQSKQAQKAE